MSAPATMIDPLSAWASMLREQPGITALVPATRIGFDMEMVDVTQRGAWIVITSQGLELRHGFWDGILMLTMFAQYGHLAEQAQRTIIEAIADPLTNFRVHRVASGPQAGAVVSVADIWALHRGQMPITGDIEWPFRSFSVRTKVSYRGQAWT
jgi:hypothetical protein